MKKESSECPKKPTVNQNQMPRKVMVKDSVPVISPKISNDKCVKYLDWWSLRNSTDSKQLEVSVPDKQSLVNSKSGSLSGRKG